MRKKTNAVNRKNNIFNIRIMIMRLFSLATTILSLIPSTTTAWTTIGPQARFPAVRPTILSSSSSLLSSSSRRAETKRIDVSKLQAIKNSEDSSATSTATLPKFPSLFNRTNDDIAGNKNNENNDAYATQERKLTTKISTSSNNDNDIGNISSTSDDDDANNTNSESLVLATAAVLTVAVGLFTYSSQTAADGASALSNFDPSTVLATGSSLVESAREVFQDPGAALDHVVELTDSMGPLGIAYFGVAYCIAEILAIPAIPLTASAGYLFGPVKGTAIVLLSASIAAGVSFTIGRTLLRDYVEGVLVDYPKFAKLDRAIGREGFKLMLLLRLSPIFPFALSNYLYGASSINFSAFFGGTLLGFAPGTMAYVYTGYVGKALTGDGGSDVYPWYVYLGGLTIFAGLLKVVADTATRVVEEIEAEEEEAAAAAQTNDDVYL